MNRYYPVLITLLAVLTLISIIGCTEAQSEPAGPQKPEAPKLQPPKVEPNAAQPAETKPDEAQNLPKVSFHDKCADILKTFVDDNGMVNYRMLKQKKPDLKNLLDEFDKLDPNEYNSWPKEDKIAFWLNTYNLQLLRIIVDNYPIQASRIHLVFWPPTSIRHIKGIWSDYKFMVMDEEFTLGEIDRRVFRKGFDEPLVFFAISQASLSGPPLRNEPYYGYKLYSQLDDQAKRFLSSPLAFKIDGKDKAIYLSTILEPNWYGREFVSKYGTDKKFKDQQPEVQAVLNFITKYIPKQSVSFLEVENYSVNYLNYDWRLNEQPAGN